jgi:hypothetical protein
MALPINFLHHPFQVSKHKEVSHLDVVTLPPNTCYNLPNQPLDLKIFLTELAILNEF